MTRLILQDAAAEVILDRIVFRCVVLLVDPVP